MRRRGSLLSRIRAPGADFNVILLILFVFPSPKGEGFMGSEVFRKSNEVAKVT